MCGIFFSIVAGDCDDFRLGQTLLESLKQRGPDSVQHHQCAIERKETQWNAYFLSTVLSLRGSEIVPQPLVDNDSGSVLCWNGEAWKLNTVSITGNDSQAIFTELSVASRRNVESNDGDSLDHVVKVFSNISGPYAFVYYDALCSRVYFGRDCLGRRSLLINSNEPEPDTLTLSSIADPSRLSSWTEVEADGLYLLNLTTDAVEQAPHGKWNIRHVPFVSPTAEDAHHQHMLLPYGKLNKALPGPNVRSLSPLSESVLKLNQMLVSSLQLRIKNIRQVKDVAVRKPCNLAILFSGGLDCSVLARLAHDILDFSEPIDLLNVAFQNPRIHKTANQGGVDSSPYELCPDRITGRKSLAELERVCPERLWRFVEINVPYIETVAHRDKVVALMSPHNTEMDLSISNALFFASRGSGVVKSENGTSTPYSTSARVLLSGLGADELFGGYQRHATAFSRHGSPGLADELELDINRLGKRNLGRDDRVISNWSKEVRFPYLDEALLQWALEIPIWEKCGFGLQSQKSDQGWTQLEEGKLVLRLLAWSLGMTSVASEKKRAIQFGARTAKMENTKVKGTHVLQ